MKMYFHITTILFIIMERYINKIFTQGIPISPCPKMFQYRYDGQEWFGILSVRNPDFGQALHLRVTLSMRGKPATNYLGEIELLTRGQLPSDTPVLYRIKFPQHHFPPKLLQIAMNNQIVCLGTADHSIFVTQIQLEHTRKFTFIQEDIPIPLTPPDYHMPAAATSPTLFVDTSAQMDSEAADTGNTGADAFVKDLTLLPTNMGFNTKHLPLATAFDRNLMRVTKDICGRTDDRIRFQVLHAMQIGLKPEERRAEKTNTTGDHLQPRNDGASHIPIVTADDPAAHSTATTTSTTATATDDAGGIPTIDELPTIARGAWPWMAAIYVNNLTSLAYQCGGTLISARVVISAAHCFQIFQKRFTANEVLVFLGRHNLKNWNEEGSLAAPVDDIFIHPDYDRHLNSYDADIAVVMLKNEVRFNTFIRPACMWSGSTKNEYIEGEHGIVVGWGIDVNQAGSHSSGKGTATTHTTAVPKIVNAPIVSNEVCFKANDKFRSLSSNRTFCAGVVMPTIVVRTQKVMTTTTTTTTTKTHIKTSGTTSSSSSMSAASPINDSSYSRQQRNLKLGPCAGDSGAGLMIYRNNRWMLRGTVSASLPVATIATATAITNPNTSSKFKGRNETQKSNCNVNQYVIYTDVGKFLDWIFAFII